MDKKNWTTWVWVKSKTGAPAEIWQTWKGNNKIKKAWSTMGDWDYVFSCQIDNPAEADEFVTKQFKSNEWIDEVQTTFTKECW